VALTDGPHCHFSATPFKPHRKAGPTWQVLPLVGLPDRSELRVVLTDSGKSGVAIISTYSPLSYKNQHVTDTIRCSRTSRGVPPPWGTVPPWKREENTVASIVLLWCKRSECGIVPKCFAWARQWWSWYFQARRAKRIRWISQRHWGLVWKLKSPSGLKGIGEEISLFAPQSPPIPKGI
jgi:hypothetical protein